MTQENIRVSYSMLSTFRNCRKACKFRYNDGLKPLETSKALRYGSMTHSALEIFHLSRSPTKVGDYIDTYYKENPNLDTTEFTITKAMMDAYCKKYEKEDFEVIWIEKDFEGPIIDMKTYEPIPGVYMCGKLDGLIKRDDGYWLLENKTASKIDGNYLEKLWSDFQIIMYCYYVKKCFNIDCQGVLYNILLKCNLKKNAGESLEDFEARYSEACNKNKSGKSNIKRKEPESDVDFEARVAEFYQDNEAFHREDIYISKANQKRVISEISELTKAYINCVKRDSWYLNTDHCFRWGKPCEYFPICRSGDNPNIINNYYNKSPRVNLYTLEAEEIL